MPESNEVSKLKDKDAVLLSHHNLHTWRTLIWIVNAFLSLPPDSGNAACCGRCHVRLNQLMKPMLVKPDQRDPISLTRFNAVTVSRLLDSSASSCASAAQQKPAWHDGEAFFQLTVAVGTAGLTWSCSHCSTPHCHPDCTAGCRGMRESRQQQCQSECSWSVAKDKKKQARTTDDAWQGRLKAGFSECN